MKCPSCGAEMPFGQQFCTNCGAQVGNNSTGYTSGQSFNSYGQNTPGYGYGMGPMPVSVGGWIGRSLIPFIPFVGWLVYLIMLFIWSGDQTKELSFRNWAKAQLVVMAILIGIAIILSLTIFIPLFFSASSYR